MAVGQVPDTVAGTAEMELIPQPHGGALLPGGMKGNRGGGRPPDRIREAFRIDLETARERIAVILDDPDADTKDIISIFDKLAKYSIGEKRDGVIIDVELLNQFFVVVERYVTSADALATIREEWLNVLGSKLRA